MSDAVTPFQAPVGTHDVLAPSSARVGGRRRDVRPVRLPLRLRTGDLTDVRRRRRLQPRHRRGERRRQEGDVRLLGPRRARLRAASRGHRVGRARLRPAQPDDAVEGVVRDAGLPLRASPGRAATASTTSSASRSSAPRTRPSTSRSSRSPSASTAALGLHAFPSAHQLHGPRRLSRGLPRAAERVPREERRSTLRRAPRRPGRDNPLRVLDCKDAACVAVTPEGPDADRSPL